MLNCPVCGQPPVVHRHRAPSQEQVDGGIRPGAWCVIECQSGLHNGLTVKTQRFATEADAVAAWEEGRNG